MSVTTIWEKFRAKPSRALAIKAMCNSCMGWEEGKDAPTGIVRTIRECTAPKYPLYPL